ncbi:3-hydroxyacyl-CoA dehydrogenase/enoyl-CoA hydratase family protein [Chloroflexi bacterium CFX5]|nr:3-hydroxyacyl-CoA dehydrogenase/enoyl-CoA hydratase family protein [Anaerolineales bacterium]MDL1918982.1 3-hydroxyacyl-CoA dehydrogenase/enoyl-CoA hydratase family protein [Chloroflexi bacterium CFX5]
MNYSIHRAVVIGSGTMGAAIAAHLANIGTPVTLLDIAAKDSPDKNKIVKEGWDRCLKARPSNLMAKELEALVTLGNLEDDFGAVAEADWVCEAIVENLKIKQDLMARIDEVRKPNAIISTNTSGIPVASIAEGRSKEFKKHFLGAHFFNPPRYLKLLEIIPTADTSKDVVEFISYFGEYRLGKGVVLCKDTPNFVGNRVAFGTGAFAMDFILENGYTVDEVDALTGPLMGRPKTATFRLMDLVGVDVWHHVGTNLAPLIPHDKLGQKYLAAEKPKKLMETLLERKWLGNKTKVGFYKEVRDAEGKKQFYSLDLNTLEHVPASKPRFDSVKAAKEVEGLGDRLKVMLEADDKAAKLVKALTYQSFQYVSSIIPEVADTPKPIDDAIRWGFMHEAGAFEIWDMLGVKETVRRMKAEGYPAAKWVDEMLKNGCETFYQYRHGNKIGAYDASKKKYVKFKAGEDFVFLKDLRGTKKEVSKNAGASLFDIGDGVGLVEFHTKMNALDDDISAIVTEAMDRLQSDFDGLVVGNEGEHFSAGANLFMVVVAAQQGMWDQLDGAIRRLQNMNMRMRYSPKPIVVAPVGYALGGGCEITMHASRVVAAAETYIGLVELGAGVIPAGAGTKEYMRRIINPAMRVENVEPFPFIQKAFLQIGQAKVATSAEEARGMGILNPQDRVVVNRDHLLTEAKKEVLHLVASGYRPPAPELIYAAGRDMFGAMKVGAWAFKEGKYITEYDAHIATKLARIIAGGDITKPTWVSEQYILDLEREAFLSLCGEEKTQARMWSILQTGKPLRN